MTTIDRDPPGSARRPTDPMATTIHVVNDLHLDRANRIPALAPQASVLVVAQIRGSQRHHNITERAWCSRTIARTQ